MSTVVSAAEALSERRPLMRPRVWLHANRVPLGAALGSRLVVLVGGLVGTSLLRTHVTGQAAVVQRQQLGALGQWLGATVVHWDANWYLNIAEHGYGAAGTAGVSQKLGFLPVYPLLIRVLGWPLRSPVLAGVLISLVCFSAALVLLHRLCELEFGSRAADVTVLLLAFAPTALFFSAIYTESLFLLFTVGSLYALRTGRWRLACVLGAVSALTRVTGIAIACALAVGRWRQERRLERGMVWVAVVPGVIVGYMVTLELIHMPATGILSAQSADWHHETVGPVLGTLAGLIVGVVDLWKIAHGYSIYRFASVDITTMPAGNVLLAGILVALLIALVKGRRRLAPELWVLLLATLVICTSSPTKSVPLWSLDRYVLTIVPPWMLAGARLATRPGMTAVIVALSAVGLLFCSAEFSIGSWVG